MLTIRIKMIEIDYEKLAERFLPELFDHDEEETGLAKRLAGKLLVKDGEASSFTRGLLKLIPNQVSNSVAVHLILKNQERIRLMINQALENYLPGISVASLRFMEVKGTEHDELKIQIRLKEVDYHSVITRLLPKLLEGISSQPGKTGRLGKLLLTLGDKPDQMLAAALDILTQEAKDKLLKQIFDLYREDIVEGLNRVAVQQNISAVVAEIRLSLKA
jgi:hypothetical protein